MKRLLLAALCMMGLGGCTEVRQPSRPTAEERTANPAPDNTAVNVRDRDDAAKTPIDQNENQTDIDITANIRQQVVGSDLSINGQNVKIITQDGKVTLRGPVKSAEEKKKIEDIALAVAGEGKVDSQLEVETQ